MRILVLADEESKSLWDYFDQSKLEGIDLILSCGDLKPEYLSFLATFAKVPILYVRGNHDDIYEEKPPDGCICIEDTIYTYQGIRILGLGGSIRYKKGKNQYTQTEMKMRVAKIWWQIKKNKGFEAFVQLLDKYKPKCFIHGHVHLTYSRSHKRESQYKETRIINGFEKYIFDY